VEPSVAGDDPATRYQFERTGYFWRDQVDGVGDRLAFNRIITLKDTWSRQAAGREERASAGAGKAPSGKAAVVGAAPRGTPAADKPRVSAERAGKRRADPELARRMERYTGELGLSPEDADLLTGSRDLSDFFEEALAVHRDASAVAGWVVNDLPAVLGSRSLDALPFDGRGLGVLARLVGDGRISRRAAKDVLGHMAEKGGEPAEIMGRLGLEKMDDHGALDAAVDDALARWPEKVAEYRAGRMSLMGLFVGEVMKATKGAADPRAVKDLLTRKLGA
jgi:glutaminyl-tRNA synthetase